MIIVDTFQQGSEEWFSACAGNPGASNCSKILTTTGARSKQREDYMMQLAGERICGKPEATFISQHMINGQEREASSRQLFEIAYGMEVKQVALVYKDEQRLFHCSPDGLVGESAGLELKNPMIKTQVKYLLEKTFPMEYFQQIQMSLYVTERDLWYFMSSYEGLPPFILEIRRDDAFIRRLAIELEIFCGELEEMVQRLGGAEPKKVEAKQELAPGECPEIPGDVMTKAFCNKCKSRLLCAVWK